MFNPVAVESFPEGEVARDIGAHVLPRGEGGHVVVVFYHTYYNRKFRAVIMKRRKKKEICWGSSRVQVLTKRYQ
jgi:hypothetical protein|tara:strand:+ start:183 stop:404 length:222 start_codon:yes stop_codon:yes gene_type:complete